MNMEFMTLLAALPLGDDTPIWLYALIGIIAVGLIVGSIFMSKKSKEQNEKNDSQDKDA